MAYPKYKSGTDDYMISPFAKVKLGNVLDDENCYFNSLNISFDDNTP